MGKKKSRKPALSIGTWQISQQSIKTAFQALNTPLGRIVLAEVLIQSAAMVARRPASMAATAEGATSVGKLIAEVAGGVAVKVMHSAADALKAGVKGKEAPAQGRQADVPRAPEDVGDRPALNGRKAKKRRRLDASGKTGKPRKRRAATEAH